MASEHKPQQSAETEADPGLAARVQDAGQRLRDTADEAGDRLQHGYQSAREFVSERGEQVGHAIGQHPASSALVSFGLGFGLGLMLTALLVDRRSDPWYSKYVPDSVRDATGKLSDLRLRELISEHFSRS